MFGFLSVLFLFVDFSLNYKIIIGISTLIILIIIYFCLWKSADKQNRIDLNIDGRNVTIEIGDIFEQEGLKVIAFNEYFDTIVDDEIISENSLNGQFINKHLGGSVEELNEFIKNYNFRDEEIKDYNQKRRKGNGQKYKLGTIIIYKNNYLLTSFAKFNDKNQANLTMPEYLEFLINFWDNINIVYSQRAVYVPIFGSGITRIKEHKLIKEQDLLKIMLWTFRISEMKFEYPAKLTILIPDFKFDKINLFELNYTQNGL